MSKNIGILLFPDAEELDFVGPFEAFGMLAKHLDQDYQLLTIAEKREPVLCAKGLRVVPDCTFDDCPELEVLLIPGGFGTRKEVDNPALIGFVQRIGASTRLVTSVCTGAFVLHRAGFLKGRKATTHWASLKELRELPDVEVVEQRFVEDGNVLTAAGVSAGIDMALYIIGLLKSPEVARTVQKFMEYYPEPPYAESEAELAGGTRTHG